MADFVAVSGKNVRIIVKWSRIKSPGNLKKLASHQQSFTQES